MGRRKIEIQPIAHERNRSVTFLKRRNGLFKKAYELGVLCSVDIAVIIFEERPGHNIKLFQYGSSNVQDILQRHVRFDGEIDSRGPNDFSGNANAAELDDIGEGDEDDLEEDTDDIMLSRSGTKRRGDGRMKPGGSIPIPDRMSTNLEYMPRAHQHSAQLNVPSSMQNHQHPSSSIPTSSDRLRPVHQSQHLQNPHSHQNKKPRIGDHSGFSSESPISPRGGNPDNIGEGSSYGYRHAGSSSAPSQQQSFSQRPSSSSSTYTQYPPFFHSSHRHGTPPPPSFIPLHQESSSSRSRGRSNTGSGAPFIQRDSSSGYDGMYAPRTSSGSGNPDLFPPLESGRGRGGGGGFGLDWPVHASTPTQSLPPPGSAPPRIISGSTGGNSGNGSISISTPADAVRTSSAGGSAGPETSSADWLDFLSGAGNTGSTPASSKGATPAHVGGGRPTSSSSAPGQMG